jgi:hypothetical protein
MDGTKLILFLVCINVFFYIFTPANYKLMPDDIISKMINTEKLSVDGSSTSVELRQEIKDKMPSDVQQTGISAVINAFVDGLALIWGVVSFIFNLLTSPVAMFTRALPPLIAMILGIPFAIGYLLVIVKFIRGAEL